MIFKILFCFVFSLFYYAEAIKKVDLQGNKLTPIFTSFNYDGSLNLGVVDDYAEYLYKNDLTTIFLNTGDDGEGISTNLIEKKAYTRAWYLAMNERCRGGDSVIISEVGFLTPRDSCDFARYCERLGIDGITYQPSSDAGPTNASQAISDLRYIAKCAPSTPIYLVDDPKFTCGRDINYGKAVAIAVETIPNFAGLIGPVETVLQARAYNERSSLNVQYISIFYYGVSAADLLDFDAHATGFANIFPEIVNQIDNSRSPAQALLAQTRLDQLAAPLCYLRPDCRLTCAVNIMKAAFIVRSGIQIGSPRSPPLCPITRKDLQDVTSILRANNPAYYSLLVNP